MREQSTSALESAIHSQGDPGEVLRRVNAVLANYYEPDLDPETKAAARMEFVRPLSQKPQWAVEAAFDAWVRTMQRRPSPGEILILVDRETETIRNELLARRRAEEVERERAERDAAERCPPEAAARIVAGFITERRLDAIGKAPLATTFAEAEIKAEAPPPRHWTDTATAAELAQLEAARDANETVIAARAAQAAAELARQQKLDRLRADAEAQTTDQP